ncbi:tubulin polyglutamylase ttll6-like isoform X3 [Bolinopsis microptera]|uniref:tubulin polyglutamylase ttll6-like isoform X3 n=1 Tax=Bolinopsis microptera TaxID=2820187 RepID=UPI00307A25DA
MCDIDVSNTIVRKDSFIGLKVAIHELSNNFNTLDLSDDDDCISTQTAVDSTADLVGTSLQVVQIPLSCSTAPTPQIEELVVPEGEGDSESEEEKEDEKIEEQPQEEPKAEKKKKKRKKRAIGICTVNCRYESVRRVARRFNFKEVGENEDWVLFWTDCSVSIERVMDMKRYQKINHFPGMSEICRKDLLARNMNRMQKLFPKEYNICPRSWCLPADYSEFMTYHRSKKNKTYIIKPDNSCQGKGIMLTKTPKVDIKHCDNFVVQQYLSKPFLIDNLKFDLRVYVLVTSCDPLRIYVYKDGLVRFAVTPYQDPTNNNVDDVLMHLTNYAITKHSSDFIRDDEKGHKRKITHLNKWLETNGYNREKIWADIEDVIVKTLIVSHPTLKHNYRTCFPNHNRGSACFEILGFDIMLDRKLKPWLLEVNHSPSFHTDSPLDKEIKEGFLADTIKMLNCSYLERKRCIEEDRRRVKERLFAKSGTRQQQHQESLETDKAYSLVLEQAEANNCGGYRCVYPCINEAKYKPFFQQSGSLFTETVASKARQECARLQREAILAKQNEGRPRGKAIDTGESGEAVGRRRIRKKVRPVPERLYKRPSFKMENLPPGSPRFPIHMTTATSPRKSDLLNDQIKGLAGSAPHQDNIFKEASRLRNLTFEKARENIVIKMPTMPINPQNDYLKVRCFLGSVSSFPTMMPSDSSFYPGMFKVLSRVNETTNSEQWDSSKPMPISEEDELERLSGMIERDNLVRGLGISEFVTEMLQTARITMKPQSQASYGYNPRDPGFRAKTTNDAENSKTSEKPNSFSQLGAEKSIHREYPVQRQRLWQQKPSYLTLTALEEASRIDADTDKSSRLFNRGMTPPNFASNGGSGAPGGSAGNQICSVYSLPGRPANNNVNLSVVSGPAPVSQRSDLVVKSANSHSQHFDVSRYFRTTKSTRIRGATNILRLKHIFSNWR